MRLQMAFGDEAIVTLVALEWPLSSVGPHVSFQVASLSELLQTVLERAYEELDFVFGSLHSFDV